MFVYNNVQTTLAQLFCKGKKQCNLLFFLQTVTVTCRKAGAKGKIQMVDGIPVF